VSGRGDGKPPRPGARHRLSFVVAPDGVIYQGQRETTRSYHVGGVPNDYSIGVSLIGRFMTRNYDGTCARPRIRCLRCATAQHGSLVAC